MEEVASTEVASTEVASTEVASEEVASTEVASEEVASTEVASTEVASEEVASTEVASTENNLENIDLSPETASAEAAEEYGLCERLSSNAFYCFSLIYMPCKNGLSYISMWFAVMFTVMCDPFNRSHIRIPLRNRPNYKYEINDSDDEKRRRAIACFFRHYEAPTSYDWAYFISKIPITFNSYGMFTMKIWKDNKLMDAYLIVLDDDDGRVLRRINNDGSVVEIKAGLFDYAPERFLKTSKIIGRIIT